MSTNKTENLNLHVWEPTDLFSLAEINENFRKLDAAVGELLRKQRHGFVWEELDGEVTRNAE